MEVHFQDKAHLLLSVNCCSQTPLDLETTNFELASYMLKNSQVLKKMWIVQQGRPAWFFWGMIVKTYKEYVYSIYSLTGTFWDQLFGLLWVKYTRQYTGTSQ